MNIVEETQHDLSGIALLRDWLGDGSAVHPMVAEARASWCIKCPLNVEPNWWDRIKSAIAHTIKMELELKNGMNLSTRHDDSLHMCRACGCCLKLKVWVPKEHVKRHTPKEILNQMPEHECWIRKELAS
jgi:hypothetical protein